MNDHKCFEILTKLHVCWHIWQLVCVLIQVKVYFSPSYIVKFIVRVLCGIEINVVDFFFSSKLKKERDGKYPYSLIFKTGYLYVALTWNRKYDHTNEIEFNY